MNYKNICHTDSFAQASSENTNAADHITTTAAVLEKTDDATDTQKCRERKSWELTEYIESTRHKDSLDPDLAQLCLVIRTLS